MLNFFSTAFPAFILIMETSGLNDPPSVDNLTSTSAPAGHVASRHLENGGHFKNGVRRSAEKEGGYCAFPSRTWSTGTDSGDAHHVRNPGFSDVRLNRSDTFATPAEQLQQQFQQQQQQDFKIWISKTSYEGTFPNWTRRRVVKVMRTEMFVRDLMRASCSDDSEADEASWNFDYHSKKTPGTPGSESNETKAKESPMETWKSRLRSKQSRIETESGKIKRNVDDDVTSEDDDEYDELMSSLPVNDGPLPCHKQEVKHHVMCLSEEPGDKYRVRIVYTGKALFSCVKFVTKANGIIQVYQAVPNVLNEDKLCHDSALQRDEWPWISLEQNRLQVNFPSSRIPANLRSTSESTDYFHNDHHHYHHHHHHHHHHHEQQVNYNNNNHHRQQHQHHRAPDEPSPSSILPSSASSPFPSHVDFRLDPPSGYNHHYHHQQQQHQHHHHQEQVHPTSLRPHTPQQHHHHHHQQHRHRHRQQGSQRGQNRCTGFGGFEFQMYSTDVKQCESFQATRGSYVEGECVEGEGVRFQFPDKLCSPFRGDSNEVNFHCLNHWTDESYSFFLLALETNRLPRYIMRLPESSRTENKSFLGTFYFNLVTPLSGQGDPPGKGTFFQMHAARRPVSRSCYDELANCAALSLTRGCYGNQEADDTLRMGENCAKTCNLCELPPLARSSKNCQFPIDLQGKWASYDKTQDLVEMFVSTGEIRSPTLGVMVCLGRVGTLFTVGTFFNNGCKPRMCCLRFEVQQQELRFKLFGCQRREPSIHDDAKSFCSDADDVTGFSSLKRRSLLPKNFKTIKCGFQTRSEVAVTTSGGNTCHGVMSDLDNSTCAGAQALSFNTWKCIHLAEVFEYQCVDYVVQSSVLRILVTYSPHEQKQSCWSIKSKEFALQNDASKRHDLKFQLRKINCTSAETIIRSNTIDEIFSIDVFRDREFTSDSCRRALDKDTGTTGSGPAYPHISDQRDSRSSDQFVHQSLSGPYHNHHHHKPLQDDDRLHGVKASRSGSDGLDDRAVGSRFYGGVSSGGLAIPVLFVVLTFCHTER